MTLRTRETIQGRNKNPHEYVREMTYLTGEYIDQFTIVPDLRTTDEIMTRIPKCMIPGWKIPRLPKQPPIDTKPFRVVDKIIARINRATNLRTGRER